MVTNLARAAISTSQSITVMSCGSPGVILVTSNARCHRPGPSLRVCLAKFDNAAFSCAGLSNRKSAYFFDKLRAPSKSIRGVLQYPVSYDVYTLRTRTYSSILSLVQTWLFCATSFSPGEEAFKVVPEGFKSMSKDIITLSLVLRLL